MIWFVYCDSLSVIVIPMSPMCKSMSTYRLVPCGSVQWSLVMASVTVTHVLSRPLELFASCHSEMRSSAQIQYSSLVIRDDATKIFSICRHLASVMVVQRECSGEPVLSVSSWTTIDPALALSCRLGWATNDESWHQSSTRTASA